MTSATPDLRYPIGRFTVSGAITEDRISTWLGDLVALPDDLRRTVTPLSNPQLDTPYRPGGWTVRQVVHHLPDSHLNCFLRFRWALTEDRPVIKPYDEALVAELPDYLTAPIDSSLDLLQVLHVRWAELVRSLSWEQLQRTYVNPESGENSLARTVGVYQPVVKPGRHPFAARSAAGVGCGEGFPLPTKDGGANRAAIRTINPWGKRPARTQTDGFGARDLLGLVRGAFTTGRQ